MKKQRPLPEIGKKYIKNVVKTKEEKILFNKYNILIENNDNYESLMNIAKEFKQDLSFFLLKRRKYKNALLFFIVSTISFAQGGVIVAGGNGLGVSYTIGNNLVELQIPIVEDEVSLSNPKFEIEKPIQIVKPNKKLTIFDKIKNLIKKLFKK